MARIQPRKHSPTSPASVCSKLSPSTRDANPTPCISCRSKKIKCKMEDGKKPCLACRATGKADSCAIAPKTAKDNWRNLTQKIMEEKMRPKPSASDGVAKSADPLPPPPGGALHTTPTQGYEIPYANYHMGSDDYTSTSDSPTTMLSESVSSPELPDPSSVLYHSPLPTIPSQFELRVIRDCICTHQLTIGILDGSLFVIVDEHTPNVLGPRLRDWLNAFALEYRSFYWLEVDPRLKEIVQEHLPESDGYLVLGWSST